MCECYQIGGRFIAEDPGCPVHGEDGSEQQIDELRTRIQRLETILVAHGLLPKD